MRNNRTPGTGMFSCLGQALLTFSFLAASAWAQILPSPPAAASVESALQRQPRLFVSGYEFDGNTAFSDTDLSRVTAPFANREIANEELEEVRRAVTLHYVSQGYVNSGAIIPDQSPTNGVVYIRVIEGVLSGVELHGNKWLRDGFITSRVRRWAEPPLDLDQLQEGLQLLRQNQNVSQINAELKPGNTPGEGVLDLRVVDRQPFRVGLQFDNQRPPSVGAEQLSLLASDLNLTGNGDVLDIRYGIANGDREGVELSGADNMEGSYTLPVTRYDTTLGVHGSRINTSLVEEPFPPLDISSLTVSYGVVLRQPVFQTANQEAALSIGFDRRENDTELLGEPFNISPGAVDGEMVVSVLRLSQEWVQRTQNRVVALRSSFNIGLDVFDATDDRSAVNPDAKFFSWLGQAQYIQRLFKTPNQLVVRLSGQWSAEPLLALEQISVGGSETVRGYRENQLVRDRGIISSVEVRVPVLFNKAGVGIVQLAPFFDFGGGWNTHDSDSPSTLYSTGVGLLLNPVKHVSAQLYWGYQLRDLPTPAEENLQDLGLHFRLNVFAF